MRLTHLALLISCCSVSVGVAGVSLWQGYAGTAEQVAAVVVAVVVALTLRVIWRASGPVHEGGDDGHLRLMPADERERITEAA